MDKSIVRQKDAKQSLVFIDDSGDPGFKLEKGSSRFFVISAVIFSDAFEAEKVALAVKQLRKDLKFSEGTEFKFHKSTKRIREEFLEKVKIFDFKIRSIIVDKSKIHIDKHKNDKNSFYAYAIKLLLQRSDDAILDAKIKIDGTGDRSFKENFTTYLRKSLNTKEKRIMKHVKFVDSRDSALIQLADMIAGSQKRYFEYRNGGKTDAEVYRNIIKSKIDNEWEFP